MNALSTSLTAVFALSIRLGGIRDREIPQTTRQTLFPNFSRGLTHGL